MKKTSFDTSLPVLRKFEQPVFKPDTETGIAKEYTPSKLQSTHVLEHKDPTRVLSDHDLIDMIEKMPENRQDPRLVRLKYLQKSHNMLIDEMLKDLGRKLERKEISETFWKALPADIRGKYKDKVSQLRAKIRSVYEQFPDMFAEYKLDNPSYFRRQQAYRKEVLKRANLNLTR